MPQGFAGLSKRNSTIVERQTDAAEGAAGRTGKYGVLRVVEVGDQPVFPAIGAFNDNFDRKHSIYLACKRATDVVGAVAAAVLLSPLIVSIVACSLLTGGGSPFFRHSRVGKDGRIFDCYKFRTMVRNADAVLQTLLDSDVRIKEEWLRDHKLRDDPRITRLGGFLRRTSLDELPQLWNVMRGDMSLVGPRPVVPEELARYGHKVGTFLSAKPGITGLWQVSGRNDTDYRRRVALDVCYVKARRFSLDVSILFLTLPAVFAKNGAY